VIDVQGAASVRRLRPGRPVGVPRRAAPSVSGAD
jgi:hypothetical protein